MENDKIKKIVDFIKLCRLTNWLDLFLVILFPILIYISSYYIYLLIYVVFIPLIILAYRNRFLKFLIFSTISQIIYSIVMTFWVAKFGVKYFFILFVYLIIFNLIFSFSLYFIFNKKTKYPISVLIPPILWFSMTALISTINGGQQWYSLARLQPSLYPLTAIIGETGIDFLIILVNCLLGCYIIFRNKKVLIHLFVIVAILFLCFVYSQLATIEGRAVKIAVIQGNFQKDWLWRTQNADKIIMDTYERLSFEAAKNKPDVIIWPEYAIPNDIFADQNLYNRISKIAKETESIVVFGSLGKTENTDPEFNYIKNVAHVFSKNGEHLGNYVSVLPFPFKDKIIPGASFPVFNTEIGKIGIITCWEEYYGFVNKEYANAGADFFINLVNDNPIQNLNAMKAKSTYARLRASENHKYVIRAANTGFSLVANPYGKVVSSMEPFKEGVLLVDIYLNK